MSDKVLKDLIRQQKAMDRELEHAIKRYKEKSDIYLESSSLILDCFVSILENEQKAIIRDKKLEKIGELKICISAIRAAKDEVPQSLLLKMLKLDETEFNNIISLIDENSTLTDEEIAKKLVNIDEDN